MQAGTAQLRQSGPLSFSLSLVEHWHFPSCICVGIKSLALALHLHGLRSCPAVASLHHTTTTTAATHTLPGGRYCTLFLPSALHAAFSSSSLPLLHLRLRRDKPPHFLPAGPLQSPSSSLYDCIVDRGCARRLTLSFFSLPPLIPSFRYTTPTTVTFFFPTPPRLLEVVPTAVAAIQSLSAFLANLPFLSQSVPL